MHKVTLEILVDADHEDSLDLALDASNMIGSHVDVYGIQMHLECDADPREYEPNIIDT